MQVPASQELVERMEVAGPGFVNIWLKQELIQSELNTLLDKVRPYLQCCGSEIIFSGSGSYLALNFRSGSGFESGSGLFMKNTLEIQII